MLIQYTLRTPDHIYYSAATVITCLNTPIRQNSCGKECCNQTIDIQYIHLISTGSWCVLFCNGYTASPWWIHVTHSFMSYIFVCFITKSFLTYSFSPLTPALSAVSRPLSSSMCSITPETANACSSYNRTYIYIYIYNIYILCLCD